MLNFPLVRPRKAATRKLTVDLEVPVELLGDGRQEGALVRRVREGIVMELLRQGLLSAGKAAEMLGLDREALHDLMNAHDLPTFHFDPEDFASSLEVARALRPPSPAA